jgi:glutaredoxin-like protein NrdH
MTKKVLDRCGVPFTAVDLSEDPEALELIRNLGYTTAPVVVAGDAHFSGFRPDSLDRIIATHGGEEVTSSTQLTDGVA